MYGLDVNNPIAVDTETTGLRAWKGDQVFAVSFCDVNGSNLYFEWDVDPFTRRVQYNEREVDIVKGIIENPKIEKVMHNAKFDVRMLERSLGIRLKGRLWETMFMAHCANCLEPTFALKPLAQKYVGIDNRDQDELKKEVTRLRREAKKLGYKIHEQVEADYWLPRVFEPNNTLCAKYAILDVERTILLFMLYQQALDKLDQWEAYNREMELWPVTYEMESRGVRVDMQQINKEILYHTDRMNQSRKHCEDLIGVNKIVVKKVKKEITSVVEPWNFNASSDLVKIFQILNLDIKVRTATGKVATNFKALEEYTDVPFVKTLLQFRAAEKALGSFFLRFRDLAVPERNESGRVVHILHPDFNQVGPVTARYSCRDPNLQNVANALTTRSSEPIQARRPFGPRDGYVMYCNDYSQLEVRIFADVSQEQTLLDAIRNDRDLHTECANRAWGGAGNPAAIHTAIQALELAEQQPSSPEVREVWEKFCWNPKYDARDRHAIADDWLAEHDYKIVEAEESLHKKTSRARAKMVLFAKLFGGGPRAIKDLLQVSYDEAAEFLRQYDDAFPDIVRYIKTLSYKARMDGFIRNRYNRLVVIDPDKAYRAVNYMVQGSAAELMKSSMIRCSKYFKSIGLDAHIVMTIHDELVFEIRKEHAYKWLLRDIKRIMEDHEGHFGLELPTEMSRVRQTWVEKEKVKL